MELLLSGLFLLLALLYFPYAFGVVNEFEFFEDFRVHAGCFSLKELGVLQEVLLALAEHKLLFLDFFLSFCHLLDAVDGHLLFEFC